MLGTISFKHLQAYLEAGSCEEVVDMAELLKNIKQKEPSHQFEL